MALVNYVKENDLYRGLLLSPGEGTVTPGIQGWVIIKRGRTFKIGRGKWKVLTDTEKREIRYIVVPDKLIIRVEEPIFLCEATVAQEQHEVGARLNMGGILVASLILHQDNSVRCIVEHLEFFKPKKTA
jgi:hypothetical protein